jgi:TetR/AcrR family transcriptional repressor of bet genes
LARENGRSGGRSSHTLAPRAKAPSRHDLPQAERRRQILAAAMHVIAHEGLSLTTMEKVGRQAGVSPGTVTFHFRAKDELLFACLDAVAREFDEARKAAIAEAGGDAAQALDNIIGALFDPVIAAPEKVAVWYAFWGEAPVRRVYMARAGDRDNAYLQDLEMLFGKLAGTRPGARIEPRLAARSLAGLLEWLWQELLVEGLRFDRREAIRMARAHLASCLERSPA